MPKRYLFYTLFRQGKPGMDRSCIITTGLFLIINQPDNQILAEFILSLSKGSSE